MVTVFTDEEIDPADIPDPIEFEAFEENEAKGDAGTDLRSVSNVLEASI